MHADVQNFDPKQAIELWNNTSVSTRHPLLMDRASHRVSSTAVVISTVATPTRVAVTAAGTTPNVAV